MRIVVTGATGNIGTALLRVLSVATGVTEVVGVCRRPPATAPPRTRWVRADVGADDLGPAMEGADAVVHLAWAIQPSHDEARLRRTNVTGTGRVIAAAAAAGARVLIHVSSVGVYSPGPVDRAVDEEWPRDGVPSSSYSRHKAEVERLLDAAAGDVPGMRIVRVRPGLVFSRRAATGVRRLFVGPLVPRALLAPSRIPVVPRVDRLRFQAVHSDDVADALHRALTRDVAGAFNLAGDPVLDPDVLAAALGARAVPVPALLARAVVAATWHARLQSTSPGWLDLARAAPVMDTTRARTLLGWAPRVRSTDALRELLEGMADGAGAPTPPLSPIRHVPRFGGARPG
ncbi:NAD-dependent epimerase/dehydratase family protein [Miltoncostaea oceani]|uniref:NAD-dependent epimerase/dehydratase family protein n=1 Tax=Miltoncostaea oceani TaxID=2843216 RepID=UPI001C3E1F18|nr:NAD-dependent epimerase/dehydratase family protein [Miltoncostaea oceani]